MCPSADANHSRPHHTSSHAAQPTKPSMPCNSSNMGAISDSKFAEPSDAAAANVEKANGSTVSFRPRTPTCKKASTTTSARPGCNNNLRITKRSMKPGLMMTRAKLSDVLGWSPQALATFINERSARTQCSSIAFNAESLPGRTRSETIKRSSPGSINISVTNWMALSRPAICANHRHIAASRFSQVTNLSTPGCCKSRITKAFPSS
mmetsp:Transcript_93015/g.236594  ORF Transcript_93015/g.236594 Transcript_93015/m.236594 type:complete len:207 (+) Transcript_93015:16-636(+)